MSTAPNTLSKAESIYARDLIAAVAAGEPRLIPIYRTSGKADPTDLGEYLTECAHKPAMAILVRVAHAAQTGDDAMTGELMRAYVAEMAAEYGRNAVESLECAGLLKEAA